MDSFFLCCFVTSMIVSIESGIMYSLLTTNSKIVYRLFEPLFDIKLLKEAMDKKISLEKEYKEKHAQEISDLHKAEKGNTEQADKINQEESNKEFNSVINSLQEKK